MTIKLPEPARFSFEPMLDRLTVAAERIADALEKMARPTLHESPTYTLTWSDREVTAHDLFSVAETVVNCALDHHYDRMDGVPYGLPEDVRRRLLPVVARHLAAKRADWRDHTVEDMTAAERDDFRADVFTVLNGTT
jgi:hypothetical protein